MAVWKFVEVTTAVLLMIISLCRPSPTAFSFTKTPENQTYSIYGENATMVWNYKVDQQGSLKAIIWFVNVGADGWLGLLVKNKDGTVEKHPKQPKAYEGRVYVDGNATLVITNVTFQDSTEFKCQLRPESKPGLKEVESFTNLVVAELPNAFVADPFVMCKEGDPAKVTCTASGTPVPQFTWLQKNSSRPLVNGTKYEIVTSGKSSELRIKKCTVEDMGYYSCNASVGPLEPSNADFFLGVVYLKEIHHLCPMKHKVTRTETTIISCPVKAYPTPDITWELSNGTVVETKETFLSFRPDELEDCGCVNCTARNRLMDDSVKAFCEIILEFEPDKVEMESMKKLRAGDRFEWNPVSEARDYILRLSGPDLINSTLVGDDKKTSVEIPYSSLRFKNPDNKPNPVKVDIEVLAIDSDAVIGIAVDYSIDIYSAATTTEVSLLTLAILFLMFFYLK